MIGPSQLSTAAEVPTYLASDGSKARCNHDRAEQAESGFPNPSKPFRPVTFRHATGGRQARASNIVTVTPCRRLTAARTQASWRDLSKRSPRAIIQLGDSGELLGWPVGNLSEVIT